MTVSPALVLGAEAAKALGLGADVPHRDRERVARQGGLGEAGPHGPEARRVGAAHGVQQGAPGEAVGAEAVQDRLVEAGPLGERGIGVERVAVTAQPVQQGLVGPGGVGHHLVGLTSRQRQRGQLGSPCRSPGCAGHPSHLRRG